jgi:serine/threonine protein kinase/Tfp pilus assembly protein PilF
MTASASLREPVGSCDVRLAELIDELTARLQAREPIDLEACLREHPEHAERLEKLLPALRMLADASASRSHGAGAGRVNGEVSAPLVGELGDFRLLREVGRGGMGVVYEAEQRSLGRRVALKMLPFAAALDGRQLQRFRNEAHAAAQLHHTNIVPVYAVGCERGVHYYTMQFIEGHTLAELIQELRRGQNEPEALATEEHRAPAAVVAPAGAGEPPTTLHVHGMTGVETPAVAARSTLRSSAGVAFFRLAAQLGVQAAEALEHAHQLGVVHRDIKPGNLLVDGRGNLWVTDFGLAHCQSQTALTLTGDLVGTLRYMSPEQALAQRVIIDYRTDVYSLGATLYELLTLEPVFAGSDRQELLRQIAFEEPRPPRRLNKGIPAELETIVLKAMEKNPPERYGTAQELADDLERWLKDEPIRAKRPTLVQRGRKWARRHRPVVWAAAAVLLVAAVLSGGAWLSWERRRIGAEAEARAAQHEAVGHLQEERWPEALSAVRRAAGVLAGVGADPGLRGQVRELSKDLEMAQRLQEAALRATAVKDGYFDGKAASAAYAEAFRWYGLEADSLDAADAGERIRARPIQRQLVAALDHWAVAERQKGGQGWAWPAAVARAADPDGWRDRLRDAWGRPDSKAVDELLATAPADGWSLFVGLAHGLRPRVKGAAGERALSLLRQVQERHPDDFWANHHLAIYLRNSHPYRLEDAVRYFSIAVALRPQSPGARLNLGEALLEGGQLDGAITQYRRAIDLKADYAEAHGNLSIALYRKGQLDEAIAEFREAIRLKGDLVAAVAAPDNEAIAEFRKAIRLRGEWKAAVAALDKSVQLSKGGSAEDWLFLAMAHWHVGSSDKAREWYEKAVTWLEKNRHTLAKNREQADEFRRLRSEAEEVLELKKK